MTTPLPVINLDTATFECVFGRGCDGICCQEGEPPIYPDEEPIIRAHLPKFLPHLRPEARAVVEADGFLGAPHELGPPMLRVVDGWCVFFNQGCVLHKVGAAEGNAFAYKPAACALFPLEVNDRDEWYVRQWGHEQEKWDLFCLNPAHSPKRAADTLRDELALAARFEAEYQSRQAANRSQESGDRGQKTEAREQQ
jgi:Fe-S-cluster containining protein